MLDLAHDKNLTKRSHFVIRSNTQKGVKLRGAPPLLILEQHLGENYFKAERPFTVRTSSHEGTLIVKESPERLTLPVAVFSLE